jgi:hypothetical protein
MRKLILAAALSPLVAGVAMAQTRAPAPQDPPDLASGSFRSNVHNELGPAAYPNWQEQWRAQQSSGVATAPRPAPAVSASPDRG